MSENKVCIVCMVIGLLLLTIAVALVPILPWVAFAMLLSILVVAAWLGVTRCGESDITHTG